MNRPYNLRGSSSKYRLRVYRPPTLKNRVDTLARKVAAQKPEIQYYDEAQLISFAGAGFSVTDIDATRELIDNASFRDYITGDKWKNLGLYVRCAGTGLNVTRLRILVYTPKRAGTSNFPALTGASIFTQIPDPTAFTTHSDYTWDANDPIGSLTVQSQTSLKMITQYNSEADIVDRNGVRIWIARESSGVGGVQVHWQLKYNNL